MGLTRQSAHATVKRLRADGLVESLLNADHRRSRLVRLTELGVRRYTGIDRQQVGWVNRLARAYLGPDVTFPPPEYSGPGGYILRITLERAGGSGPSARQRG
jgi:hypothetical protein